MEFVNSKKSLGLFEYKYTVPAFRLGYLKYDRKEVTDKIFNTLQKEYKYCFRTSKYKIVIKWKKPKKIKGTICIIHGLGEHQNRYKHVSDFFANNGFRT